MPDLGLLVDSHALVWLLNGDDRLGQIARAAIETSRTNVFVSAITPWELQIKRTKMGKPPYDDSLLTMLSDLGLQHLPIEPRDGLLAGALPRHHGDPFDRMLIAQCMRHKLAIVSADRMMRRYDIPVLPATA